MPFALPGAIMPNHPGRKARRLKGSWGIYTVPSVTPAIDEVLIVGGQSLAQASGVSGSGSLPSGWVDTPRVLMWNNGSGGWATYSPAAASTWGPEVAWAKQWLAANSGNSNVLRIVKRAEGGSQLGPAATYGLLSTATSDWYPTTVGGYFLELKNYVVAAKATLTNPKVLDVLWIQGETDSKNAGATAAYGTNENALYAAFRAQMGDSQTRFTTHVISRFYGPYDWAGLLASQRSVVSSDPLAFIVETAGLTYQSDTIHLAATGINTIGQFAYDLTHGTVTPTGLAISASSIPADAAAGTTVGQLSVVNRDGRNATVFTQRTASANFQTSSSGLVTVKSGATLTNGASESLTFRATSYSGTFVEFSQAVTVTAAAGGSWWATGALVDLDYANTRFYVGGTAYTSIAAMVSAGVYVDGSIKYVPATAFGGVPAEVTLIGIGVNGSAVANGNPPEYIATLDDGDDATPTDELYALTRGINSATPTNLLTVFSGGTSQTNVGDGVAGASVAPSAALKFGGRMKLNDMVAVVNGTAGTTDTSCVVPVTNRLIIGDRSVTPFRPWTGTIQRVQLLNYAMTNAQMVTATS